MDFIWVGVGFMGEYILGCLMDVYRSRIMRRGWKDS